MVPMKFGSESSAKFRCECCDYNTSRNSQYVRHISTLKHKILSNPTEKSSRLIVCECGKKYSHASTLYAHKRKCKMMKPVVKPVDTLVDVDKPVNESVTMDASSNVFSFANDTIIMELLKQNSEFKDMIKEQNNKMMEWMSKGIGNTTISNNKTTNKNKFNLNFFLNEQCKDAVNIMDFVNTMQLQLSDLERVGELGFVKGISHIVVNRLKDMDVYKRPIHCSDLKRETLYVKDKDAWEKEGMENRKISKMIKHVAHKNLTQIYKWQKENPGYVDSESPKSEDYLKMVGESMGGSTEEEDATYCNKIIKNIAKEVFIEREKE